MDSRKVLVAVATCSVLLASCGSNTNSATPPAGQTPAPSAANQPAGPAMPTVQMPAKRFDQVVKDFKSDYVETPEVQQCLVQAANSCLSQSVNRAAQDKSDVKICDDLSDENFRHGCKSMVANSLAQKNQDSKYCDSLEGYEKRSCVLQTITSKASADKKAEECEEIGKALPAEKVAETASGTMAPPPSMEWTSAALASQIENCRSMIIMQTATKASDCDVIKEAPMKNACEQSIKMRSGIPAGPSMMAPPPAKILPAGASAAATSPSEEKEEKKTGSRR